MIKIKKKFKNWETNEYLIESIIDDILWEKIIDNKFENNITKEDIKHLGNQIRCFENDMILPNGFELSRNTDLAKINLKCLQSQYSFWQFLLLVIAILLTLIQGIRAEIENEFLLK